MAKLYVKAFGIACGLVVAALTFIVGTLNMLFYFECGLSRAMAIVYLGYRPTLFSIITNSFFGFIFAFCIGAAVAWFYNRIIEESSKDIEEKIKAAARSIWESKGKPEGDSSENWKEAEKRVRGF
ncbi:MAG: DUF2934 domain-containing protein [Candidatus Omnitrophica bacterium]|nr:DUF2934 domain-containing protein [Candidatus Omnitrophota bacterium]